jgi:hypothetical protein
MAEEKLNDLKEALRPGSGRHVITVSDNTQTFIKPRDHRIGREKKMIKGLAGTAVEMQDADPGVFDLRELVRRQALQERKTLTAEMILADIDATHLENVTVVQIMDVLVQFAPVLTIYSKQLKEWSEEKLPKNPIPKNRHTKITPLATNSSDEMLVQEMKQGVLDFASTQMGIDKETLDNRCWIYSGDGKTFDQLLKLKNELLAIAGILAKRHATTQAHKRALFPREDYPNNVPLGSPWIPREESGQDTR